MKAVNVKRILPIAIVALLALVAGISLLVLPPATQAQTDPYPVTLTMTGPATAAAGQEITYRVRYELTDPETLSHTAVTISFSQHATFISSQVISGTPGVLRPHSETFWRWSDLGSSTETEGEIEMIVRIDDDFVGSVFAGAYVPGTNTTSSNFVETQVFAQGMLPLAGGGGPAASPLPPVAPALMMLVGVMLLCIGATARAMRRFG